MDQFDRAQALEQQFRDAALKAAQPTGQQAKRVIGEVVLCQDCDTEIPPKRLAVLPNATRCILCQQIAEAK